MGLFAKIFGSNKVIDASIKSIDAMFYTNQERAEGKIKLLKAYEPYSLALRFLMMIISIPFVLLVVVLIIASFWVSVTEQFQMLIDALGLPFTLVNSFYFGNILTKNITNKNK